MKNAQVVRKTAKTGIEAGFALVPAETSHATKTDWPKQKAAHTVDPDLHQTISREAYFRSERRGFAAGSELQDWVEAEKDVLRRRNLDVCMDSTKQ